jgi:hypothetical protein
LPLLDGQVHHDTHAVPRGNYVIGAGNYLIATPSELGNYMIADTQQHQPGMRHDTLTAARYLQAPLPAGSVLSQLRSTFYVRHTARPSDPNEVMKGLGYTDTCLIDPF